MSAASESPGPPTEPTDESERRYRVVMWFNASDHAAEVFADALDRVWDDHQGITSMQSQLAVLEERYAILAEPIKRVLRASEA